MDLGIDNIMVVVGYRGDEIRTALGHLGKIGQGLRLQIVENPDWRLASGSSLLCARDHLTERCFSIFGDRVVHKEVLAPLCRLDASGDESVMIVDSSPQARRAPRSAARVKLEQAHSSRVVDVGFELGDCDAVDCGHALVSPAIIEELRRAKHPTVSDGVRGLALRGLVSACSVGGRSWRPMGEDASMTDDQKTQTLVDGLLAPKGPRYVLLNPGPVNTTARVKSALVHHDVCHRDSDYSEAFVRLSRKLRRVFRGGPDYSVAILTGSGTAAMECAIASCVPHEGKILVLDNGAFGERLAEIARLHDMDLVHVQYEYGQEIRIEDVRRAFAEHSDIAAVAMCHHETSVGLLNPVREVGKICRELDALLLVDAVSSLGAEDLDVERDLIDVCWSSGNKCLHGIAGVGFVCVSPRTWAKIAGIKPRVYYLDLKRYRRYAEEHAQTPFTPAVATYFALDAACDEYLADGAAARQAMYAARNHKLREGLKRLGLGFFTETGNESHSVVTPRLPEYVVFKELYETLKGRGFIIYDCKPPLQGKYFQIANMGDLPDETLDAFLVAFGEALSLARSRQRPAKTKQAYRSTSVA
jgi:2-aminoethylphosphonate-pyruvate transaminase